jgi:hypothetical protein
MSIGISSSSLRSSTSWTGLLEADGRLAKILFGQLPATAHAHHAGAGARNAAKECVRQACRLVLFLIERDAASRNN